MKDAITEIGELQSTEKSLERRNATQRMSETTKLSQT